VRIAPELVQQIAAHALEDPRIECCGVVAVAPSDDGEVTATRVYRAHNAHASALRFSLVTARPRRRASRMNGSSWVRAEKNTLISPPSSPVSAGPPPRYGMWRMSIPARAFKSSPSRCGSVPLPAEPNVSTPGCAFASRTSSATEVAWTDGCTARISVLSDRPATGANVSDA